MRSARRRGILNTFPTGFSPLSLSPALWLDASDTTTITASSGDVSQWNDKSGNNRHVSQSNSTNQPKTGTTTQNGLNVIAFDGTNDVLRSANDAASFGVVHAYAALRSQSVSRAMIGVPDQPTTHSDPFFRWLLFHAASNQLNIRVNGTSFSTGNNVVNTGAAKIYRLETDEGDAYVNTTRVINQTGATVTYPNSVPFIIGSHAAGGEYLNGFVCEIVVMDRALTTQEKTDLNDYLLTKWGIT